MVQLCPRCAENAARSRAELEADKVLDIVVNAFPFFYGRPAGKKCSDQILEAVQEKQMSF